MTERGTETGEAGGPQKRAAPFKPAAPPPIDFPKATGSLRGLGEKFRAGGATGTGAMQVPLPVSPCRGVQPSLSLAYDSAQGQGPFGIGWTVAIPAIARRTDKGIPRYNDAGDTDIFVLSGQEDLVPVLTLGGTGWKHISTTDGDERVDAYRPRVEGLFARIERRTNVLTGDVHWRSITSDNVTSVFGLSPGARIFDPANPRRIFKWLLEATFDAKGHAVLYEYKPEDLTGIAPDDTAEASRRAATPANRYVKRVHYGNRVPLATRDPSFADLGALSWLFELVFDYGEHVTDLPAEAAPWTLRDDPFSSYRAGFEIRTYRLCRRVLMFHEMAEFLGAPARLVRALEIGYDPHPAVTYLTSLREVGYAWDDSDVVTTAAMPTLSLDYTRADSLSNTIQFADASLLAQAPAGIDGVNYRFVDLDGEGIAGILASAASPAPALMYKRNLGSGRFAPGEILPAQPSSNALAGDVQLLSLNADGRLDAARMSGPVPGFHERSREFGWKDFATFSSLPAIDFKASGVHLLDIDGDGLTDILVAEDDVFVWYPSLSRQGFGAPRRVTQAHDEDRGAAVLATGDRQSIFFADMSGDGLSDIVRVGNGAICYWPNLGYGRFGPKITMRSAPIFDAPDLFDLQRIRFGDIDGSGTADIVYLGGHGAVVYFNQAGNGWSKPVFIPLPHIDSLSSVMLADLLGTGTSCLLWSSTNPLNGQSALRYVDLLNGTKPHLLNKIVNGIGAETAIAYTPATQYYLADRLAGRPWATRVPFVVQTVAQVTTVDLIASTTNVVRYRYAHGFYDGVEREFRGFARVDSWDAVSMSDHHGAGPPPGGIVDDGEDFDLPPVHTITWTHTGAWNGEGSDLAASLAKEFFAGDAQAVTPPNIFPTGLGTAAQREACRALKGRMLRQEIYADDGTPQAALPYSVTSCSYEVRELQPVTDTHGVYFTLERESLAYHYERNTQDPRIQHTLKLEVDPLGHVLRDAQLAYARRSPAEPEQSRASGTCGQNIFALAVDAPYDFLHGVATESLQYELPVPATATPMSFSAVDTLMQGAVAAAFDAVLAPGVKRTLAHHKTQYWSDDLSAPMAQGTAGTRPLVYDQFALVLPATLLASVFGGTVSTAEMIAAGYVSPDGDFWRHAGTTGYDAANFFQATRFTDPFGNVSTAVYDSIGLFVVEEHSSANPAFDNVTKAAIDYRVLQPDLVTDANGNRTAAAFDPLGMVVANAVMGAGGEGDSLADPTTRTEYDLLGWQATPQRPASVHTYAREQHGAGNPGWFETYSYSDGCGNAIMKKAQAEPDQGGNPRWAATGRTVFDNKNNPIKVYEPYFAPDHSYDSEAALAAGGYCRIQRYDPLSRLIRTDFPDGTFASVTFDPWSQTSADGNDNVLESAWYQDASTRPGSDPLNRASVLAAACANTPAVQVLDPLGRAFLSIADNGAAGKYSTRTALDIQSNALSITDANGTVTRTSVFDAQGASLKATSPESGTSRSLADGAGKPYRSLDSRLFARRMVYDVLSRPVQIFVTPPAGAEYLAEQSVYGEGLAAANFRGRLYQHFDGAGVHTNATFDFKGNVTHATLQNASQYQQTPSWDALKSLTDPNAFLPAAAGALEGDVFDSWTAYDAMNRAVSRTTPDGTKLAITYNAASLLGAVDAYLRGSTAATPMVAQVDYNARGQRLAVAYAARGIVNLFTYDDRTSLVQRVQTIRQSDGSSLQDLTYTYDAARNAVQIGDAAQQANYFSGSVTDGTQLFTFDAIYRLVSATGREQPGQVGYALGPDGYAEAPVAAIPNPNDLAALVAYSEKYSYDAVGNLLTTVHVSGSAGWTRTQTYVAGTNLLDRVSMPGDPAGGPYSGAHQHDAAGNMIKSPNLSALSWDHAGRLVSAGLGGGGTVYFTYDASGQRVRKIVVRNTGQIVETVYVGAYERYREMSGTSIETATIALERETVHADDGVRRFAMVETKTVDVSVTTLAVTPLFRFQFPNHLGSACLETDAVGVPISYEEYYPFGASAYRAGDIDKRYRFLGRERDEETGFYLCGARYYAPWLARWISRDPAGLVDGTNLYAYARCNPVRLSDPGGMQSKEEDQEKNDPTVGGDWPGLSFSSLPTFKLDPPNFLSSSYSQSLGIMSPGSLDLEANLYGQSSRFSGLEPQAKKGGGLQNADVQVRRQILRVPGLDLGFMGGGSYTSQGVISGDSTTRGLFASGLAHYAGQWGSGVGLGAYLSGGVAAQRTDSGSWVATPTFGITGVVGYEPKDDDAPKKFRLSDLRKPSESRYKLGFQGIDASPSFTYTKTGQLSQGPTLHNLYTAGGYGGPSVTVGDQLVLLPEAGAFYSHGSAMSGSDQSASSVTWRVGIAATFNWIGHGSDGPQSNSISAGFWYSHEKGSVAGTAAPGAPVGGFTTNQFNFGLTFGYRKP